MEIPLYQIDAFAERPFIGNPAAVCPLPAWLPDTTLQALAAENNLSETAFLVPEGSDYRIRWFTPTVEVDLCGHATLAAAHVLFRHYALAGRRVSFHSRSGPLHVTRHETLLTLDFPAQPPVARDIPETALQAFSCPPIACYEHTDLLLVFPGEADVAAANPDLQTLSRLAGRGVIITAPGSECDFVSRFFAPAQGIPEDPVTGSAHTQLVPYWAAQTGKSRFHCRQLSARGGQLWCDLQGERVLISGSAVTYLEGRIRLPDTD